MSASCGLPSELVCWDSREPLETWLATQAPGNRNQEVKTVNSCKVVSALRHTEACNGYAIYVWGCLKKLLK